MSTATIERTTLTRAAAMPRVNLLPPEIAEAAKVRQLRVMLLGVGGLAVAGVMALYFGAAAQADSAAEELAATQAVTAQLNATVAEYANVPAVYAQVAAAETELVQAMGQEVRYSFLMNDLSLTIPNGVWLTSLTVEQPLQPVNADGSVAVDPAAPAVTSPFGAPGIASVAVEGYGLQVNDVAAWLDSLTKQAFYIDPAFTEATKEEVQGIGTEAVSITSGVTVTDTAYSNRYTAQAGE
jgi:Tfp pilus assembly protein PilN